MESLKFLMVTTHYPPHHLGGDAVFVEYLSKELAIQGHEVHVFYNPTTYELFRQPRKSLAEAGKELVIRHAYMPRFRRLEPALALALGLWRKPMVQLQDLVDSVRPDVVHWHNSRGFIGVPALFGDEVALFTSHDYSPVCPRSNLLKPDLRVCERAHLCTLCCLRWRKPPHLWRIGRKRRLIRYPFSMKIIAPSQFMADRLKSEGVNVAHLLRNFVPDKGETGTEVERRDDLLVYQGMLEKHKGVLTMLEAFVRSSGSHGFQLEVVGDGSLRPTLERMVSAARISERVRIRGFLDEATAERLRRSAAAQLMPSEWFENSPLTVLEAFSYGLPVIGADIGGIPEIVGPESGSVVFRSGDAGSLANTIIDVWNRRDELPKMGARARRAFEQRFRAETHLRRYLEILRA